MALPPNPVSAPAAPLDPAMAPATESAGPTETVLLTITTTPVESGGIVYKAYKGEKSEAPVEGDEEDAGGGAIAESSDVGAVLKAAMDVMKAAEKDSGPSMSEDDEYKQGFSGTGPVRM